MANANQVGVTRFNMDGSGSNHSASTANSPMMNRDVQHPFDQGINALSVCFVLLSIS